MTMATLADCVLFRHGIAEDATERGVADAERRLTPRGQERTRQAAEGLRRWLDEPIEVLRSPLVRAHETAAIIAEVFGAQARELGALAPGQPTGVLGRELAMASAPRLPVAVGHEPDLSELVAWVLGASSDAGLGLKKASACRLSLPVSGAPYGRLHWLLPPRLLRCLGDER